MDKKEIKAIVEEKNGELIAIASTDNKDRVGDVLKVTDWDFANFKKNPVLQAGHDYRPEFTIGRAENIKVEGSQVTFKPVFHSFTELARGIGDMYRNGFLKAFSVGFIPGQGKIKNELLEISAVAVPANPYALLISKALSIPQQDMESIKKWVGSDKEVVTKSPACRVEGETEEDCRSRKIAEIMKEDPEMDNDQAVAMASSMCSKKCETEKSEVPPEEVKLEEDKPKEDAVPVDIPALKPDKTDEQVTEDKPKDEVGVTEEVEVEKIKSDESEGMYLKEKEGRVISSKNREIVKNAVDSVRAAIKALEEFANLGDEIMIQDNRNKNIDDSKGQKTKVADEPSTGRVVLRALQKIASNSNYALNQIKKQSK